MPEQLYSENYRINPIPFDASDDRIQFYCSFLSTWKPGFTGKSAGGTHAVYSLVLQGKYHLYYKERKYTVPEAHFTINRIWDSASLYESCNSRTVSPRQKILHALPECIPRHDLIASFPRRPHHPAPAQSGKSGKTHGFDP